MGIADQEQEDVLLRRAAKGDEEAFSSLYRRHQAALYRFALRMTGNAWASEEIVQDVFMTLMRDPRKYDATRGSLGGFLYGVARNRVMDAALPLPRCSKRILRRYRTPQASLKRAPMQARAGDSPLIRRSRR